MKAATVDAGRKCRERKFTFCAQNGVKRLETTRRRNAKPMILITFNAKFFTESRVAKLKAVPGGPLLRDALRFPIPKNALLKLWQGFQLFIFFQRINWTTNLFCKIQSLTSLPCVQAFLFFNSFPAPISPSLPPALSLSLFAFSTANVIHSFSHSATSKIVLNSDKF